MVPGMYRCIKVFENIWKDAGQTDGVGGVLRGPWRTGVGARKPRGKWLRGNTNFTCSALNI